MKKITKTAVSLALIFAACLPSEAKSKTLTDFTNKVQSSLVSFDYSFTCMLKGTKMTGKGTVKVQDDSFHMNGNGLDIWCDGKTRWTIDTFAEEAMIEPVGSTSDSQMTNPALLITKVDEAFTEVLFGPAKFGGKVADSSVLGPVHKSKSGSSIAQLMLFFKTGTTTLIGAQVKMNDGTTTDFTITDLKYEAKLKQKEPFRFNEQTLGSSYVITDLR